MPDQCRSSIPASTSSSLFSTSIFTRSISRILSSSMTDENRRSLHRTGRPRSLRSMENSAKRPLVGFTLGKYCSDQSAIVVDVGIPA